MAKKLMRWNRSDVAREFGLDSRTLGKRLAEADLDTKEQFTTKEIFSALVGDLGVERVRETRERADKLAMENAARRLELVEVKAVADSVNRAIGSIRGYILGLSNLPEEDRDEILLKCRALYEAAFPTDNADGGDVESSAPADS